MLVAKFSLYSPNFSWLPTPCCTSRCWYEVAQSQDEGLEVELKPAHYNCSFALHLSPVNHPPTPFLFSNGANHSLTSLLFSAATWRIYHFKISCPSLLICLNNDHFKILGASSWPFWSWSAVSPQPSPADIQWMHGALWGLQTSNFSAVISFNPLWWRR